MSYNIIVVLLSVLCLSSINAHANYEYSEDGLFLGAMAGRSTNIKINTNGDRTYARIYENCGSNDLREKISKAGHDSFGKGYKKFGEDYSYTPAYYGRPFSSRPTSMPGGGFFLTVKELQGQDAFLNCFAYALGTYGSRLEEIAGKPMNAIQESVKMSIGDAVASYFECIKGEPHDGDLVIYQTRKLEQTGGEISIPANTNTHAGIYRKSKQNWNSPAGGTVESKWGWLCNPYVFQHDFFFTPPFYGDVVKIYRLKSAKRITQA